MTFDDKAADDISAASACVLFNLLPDLLTHCSSEVYTRLKLHIETAIRVYVDQQQGWGLGPEPSLN